jgi:hypothetical protein
VVECFCFCGRQFITEHESESLCHSKRHEIATETPPLLFAATPKLTVSLNVEPDCSSDSVTSVKGLNLVGEKCLSYSYGSNKGVRVRNQL